MLDLEFHALAMFSERHFFNKGHKFFPFIREEPIFHPVNYLPSQFFKRLFHTIYFHILFIDENPVSIDLPDNVELAIAETSEGLKGDTANNPTKPAVLETGLTVQVPLFVKQGDVIKINTKDSVYMGCA